MPFQLADFYARKVEDHLARGQAMSAPPTSLKIRLYRSDDPPTKAGGGTESAYPGYARVTVTAGAPQWGASGAPLATQASVTFPAPTGTAGTTYPGVGHIVVTDQADNWLWLGPLEMERIPTAGTPLVAAAGDLGLSVN